MFAQSFWGIEGFEELRKYLKHGTELSREIGSLLQERADLELSYAKALSKIGAKLSKATHIGIGTLVESWCLVGAEMEAEAELHRCFGQALLDDIYKLIKSVVESQTKARKPIESTVEKSLKAFLDRRSDESKCKKNAFSLSKDREKMFEQVSIARDGKVKNMTDKELAKLEKKLSQLEECLSKADKDYYETSRKAEAARQDWESQVFKACGQLQTIEEERIRQMQDMLSRYKTYLTDVGPKMTQGCEKMNQALNSINLNADIRRIAETKGKTPNQSEQLLLDYYAEERGNHMDMERRKQALKSYLYLLEQDLEKERKGQEGVVKLMDVYKGQPSFGNAVTQEDGVQRLANVSAMLRYLEANHAKIGSALADLNGEPKQESKYTRHIDRTKDKQGFSSNLLRMASFVNEGVPEARSNSAVYRPPAEGSHFDDTDFDELPPYTPISQCTAIYDFVGRDENELTIRPGDIITVYEKHTDGWWHGELKGQNGIFPGSYVK